MYCPKCGKQTVANERYCNGCGYQFMAKHYSGKIFAILAVVLLIVLSGTYVSMAKKNFNEKLISIKSLVVGGEFDEALSVFQELKNTNKVSLYLNKPVDFDVVEKAIQEQRLCVMNEYPTYYQHSGIAGCVFWMRHDDLEKRQVWINQFKEQEDKMYCSGKYPDESSYSLRDSIKNRLENTGSWSDPKCNYEAFKTKKRNENWEHLVSPDWDGFTEFCALKSCPLSETLNF